MDKSDPTTEKMIDPTTGKPGPSGPASEPLHAAEIYQPGQQSESEGSGQALASAVLATDAPPGQKDRIQAWAQSLLARWDAGRVKDIGIRAAKVAAIVFGVWFSVVLLLIVVYRFVNPPFSNLMLVERLGGTRVTQKWVPLEAISPNLHRAVIMSEDGRFCRHWGIDFAEVLSAINRASGGTPRGASTITMQVSKNLFLWPSKSYVRKALEVPVTFAIEFVWPKRRILEVYLNIAEWDRGVFGAEAAARAHFKRSAKHLTSRQAALLAVALPNPFTRDAGNPGAWTSRRASRIQRLAARSTWAVSCIQASSR
ncbi:MAG: monofunctional biosynthetic peptidoglycan transglycosylase [Hyphomicrobium sp.]